MSYTTIDLPTEYFEATTYTGNGSSQSIVNTSSFQPDLVYIKSRSIVANGMMQDIIRGAGKSLFTNTTLQELGNSGDLLSSFNSNGFTVNTTYDGGTNETTNQNGSTYIGWQWKANGAGVSNTAGTISSTVSANTTSGFSIVSYTGTGANATVGHGLGVAPKMIIFKNRSATKGWPVYHASNGATKFMFLNETGAVETYTPMFNDTSPTSSVFSIGTDLGTNVSTNNYIAYCFAEVKGYSKFGSYTGNGSTDGTFVYTGFRPAFILVKGTSSGRNWLMQDNKRGSFNVISKELYANLSDAEYDDANNNTDFVSNGFKCRFGTGNHNTSGETYIYMAFAENPFVSSKGIPTTAR